MTKKFENFKAALERLCVEHDVALRTTVHGGLQAINLTCADIPLICNGFEDLTRDSEDSTDRTVLSPHALFGAPSSIWRSALPRSAISG
jgi:hypothetical protein